MGQLRQRLGEQPVKFVFLATEHPGIPDIEILDKLLDVRSALLTQDRGLHNLAIGRGFRDPQSDGRAVGTPNHRSVSLGQRTEISHSRQ